MRPDPVIATSCASVNIFLKKSRPRKFEDMQKIAMQVHREIAGLKIGITHHLPDKNWGRELIHIGEQKDFDRLVTNPSCDIAVYGHIHQQFFRYGTGGELIINPGSIVNLSFWKRIFARTFGPCMLF